MNYNILFVSVFSYVWTTDDGPNKRVMNNETVKPVSLRKFLKRTSHTLY